jgi:predicted MFS family arabinose efflux permease
VTFSHRTLRTLFLLYFLGFFAYGAFDSLESLFYRDVLRVSGDWMGWLSACAGVGATAGSLLVLRVSTKRLTLGTLSALLLVTGANLVNKCGPFVASLLLANAINYHDRAG